MYRGVQVPEAGEANMLVASLVVGIGLVALAFLMGE